MSKAVDTNVDNMGYFNPPNVYMPAILDIELVGEYNPNDGAFNTYRITQNDGKIFEFAVKNGSGGSTGRGIENIVEVSPSTVSGGTNVIRVFYTDGSHDDFEVLNGAKGDKGDTGERGPAGVDTVNAAIGTNDPTQDPSVDKTFVDGVLGLTFNNIKGAKGDKGDKGNTGSSVDFPYELVTDVETNDDTKGLAASQGVVLDGKISQLGQEVGELSNAVAGEQTSIVSVPITIHTENEKNGYWNAASGAWAEDNNRRSTDKIDVAEGEKYYVTTHIGTSTAIAYLALWNGNSFVGVATGFTGGSGNAEDKEYIVPSGVTKIAICSYDTTEPSLKKEVQVLVSKSYTKLESDGRYERKGNSKYGVKWSISDINDLGTRTLGAEGKNATIGIGTTDGSSDFDNIWPWSGMKRCNIKANANGAKIITFEGEDGFALDGSNGDVFVRIPKFVTDHYVEDGYEHIIIGEGSVHPAFIEDGVELDEIFLGAFEASMVSNALASKSGVIPANNYTAAEFLAAAKARGGQYTLADMRSVDAVWRLMAVEYGCRNSNRVIGYGCSDYYQAAAYQTWSFITQAGTDVNTVICGVIGSAANAARMQTVFAIGNNICICDSSDNTIIFAERKITAVSAENGQNLSITFDGDPIDVTTSMIVGNAPTVCGYCESIGSSYKLNWHTGRANKAPVSGSGLDIETINPCRYRWIENPVGNVWQILPDITFVDKQMYVCESMKDYEMFKNTSPYKAVGPVLPEQSSNGVKTDVNTVENPNYWLTGTLINFFAKGNNFGHSFDTVHDGTLTSKKGYGGYYYLSDGGPWCVVNGGGFDHLWRCNILTNRPWLNRTGKWYLYGARLMFKNI